MRFYFALSVIISFAITSVISAPINATSIVNDTEIYSTTTANGTIQYQWPDEIICNTPKCEVYCDITSGCSSITIDASLANSLILQCTAESSCESVTVTGPVLNIDIYCMDQRACYGVNFDLDNTANINLNCNTASSSSGLTGACLDSTVNANYAHNVDVLCTNGAYNCDGIEFYVQYVTNHVEFNIGGYQTFYRSIIHAEYIENMNGLAVNCNGNQACGYYSDIKCPHKAPCNISCTYSKACYLAQVTVPNNQYSNLLLDCDTGISDSCSTLDIMCSSTNSKSRVEYMSLPAIFGCPMDYACCPLILNKYMCGAGGCNVNCMTQSCQYWVIDASLASSLTVQCSSASATNGYGCIQADIICPAGDGSSCSVICTEDYSCHHISITTQADTMDTFSIQCAATYSCENAVINTSVSLIDNINIDCSADASCQGTNFYFRVSDTTLLDINCINSVPPTHSSDGSCNSANFHISAAQNSNTTVTVPCGQSDCYYTMFNFSNIASVILQCNAPDACRVMDVYASEVGKFQVDCGEEASCADSQFYCPYTEANACNINCGNYGSSCSNLDIHVDDDFVLSYLDLSCPNSDGTNTDSCWSVSIYCDVDIDDDNAYKNAIDYIWYDQVNSWGCSDSTPVTAFCCPWATESPTSIPTESPMQSPTVSPITTTYDPTSVYIDNTSNAIYFAIFYFVYLLPFFVLYGI